MFFAYGFQRVINGITEVKLLAIVIYAALHVLSWNRLRLMQLIVELNCSILKPFEVVAQLGERGAVGAKVVGSTAVV
jgi:hypothetical protein